MASQRYFESGTALHRVLIEAPFLPRCSDDKTATRVRPRHHALAWPYMQVNRAGMVSWLVFDLDHTDSWAWEDAGLPAPNLIVRDPVSGRSHVFYAIAPVCTSERARSRPIDYMRAIREAMTGALRADPQYHGGPVARTPGHPCWQTTELHNVQYELATLAEYVELAPRAWVTSRSPSPPSNAVPHSRHCDLFERLRRHAYSILRFERAQGSFERFSRRLEGFADEHNRYALHGFANNLPAASLNSTVRSVARWTWDRYRGAGGVRRGVMALDDAEPLAERQRLAANRTHEQRRRRTTAAVRTACEALVSLGKSLTLASVAQAAHVTRQTVATYRHVIEEILARPPVLRPQRPAVDLVPGVKHAVHQVTAALAKPLRRQLRVPAAPYRRVRSPLRV